MNDGSYIRTGMAAVSTLAAAAVAGGLLVRSGLAQTVKQPAAPSQVQKQAQPPTPAPTGAHTHIAPPDGEDGLACDLGDGSDRTGIWQIRNWTYTRNDMIVTGTTGVWNQKADTLDTNDPIVMDDKKHHLTADKAHIEHAKNDPDKRLVVLTGHAVMILKPDQPAGAVPPAAVDPPGSERQEQLKNISASTQTQGSLQADQKNLAPTVKLKDPQTSPDRDRQDVNKQKGHGGTITCDKIEYKTRKKFATLTGHVVFKQSFADDNGKRIERMATCEHAENDDKANKLRLFKPVHYEDNENKKLETKEDVVIGTKEGDETITLGPFITTFPSESSDDDDNGSTDKAGSKATSDKGDKKKGPQ